MKRGRIPLWLLRDLPALIGIAWSFWPLMFMVISNGRRAMRGRQVHRGVYDALMQMLPIAEARLRFALHRQAYRALGWNPRAIALDQLIPVTSWSDFGSRFEAYRASMMDLHASAAFFLDEHRRRHHIRTRVDANVVCAAHGRVALCAAQLDLAHLSAFSNGSAALILRRPQAVSKDEGGLTTARGPPRLLQLPCRPRPQRARATENAPLCLTPISPRTPSPPSTRRRTSRSTPCHPP